MRPILALELSQDGIKLHELSYDSAWRELGFASLEDENLPEKMAELRAMARSSQGRFFKNELWVPYEQFFETTLQLSTLEDADRLSEAYAMLNEDEEFVRGDYVVQIGEPDAEGFTAIAVVDRQVLEEARRFAHGYKFGSDGITASQKLDGFYQQPYFQPSQSLRIPVNFRAIGFYLTLALIGAGVVAGAVTGGMWLYKNIDLSSDSVDQPEEIIEIVEEVAPETASTDILTFNPEGPTEIPNGDDPQAIPAEAPPVVIPDTSTGLTFDPATTAEETPETIPEVAPQSSLPTEDSPETAATTLPEVDDSAGPAEMDAIASSPGYVATANSNLLEADLTQNDILPSEDITTALSAQLQKLNDSLGLSQIRENQQEEIAFGQMAELQLLPPVVITTLPETLPVLRSGAAITAPVAPEIVTEEDSEPGVTNADDAEISLSEVGRELTIVELQAIPPAVFNRLPDNIPVLRNAPEDGANTNQDETPVDELVETPEEPEVATIPTPIDPETSIADLTEGVIDPSLSAAAAIAAAPFTAERIAALQAVPANVITGRPANQPILRDGIEIPQGDPAEEIEPPSEEQSDAERLRPIIRPNTVEAIAVVNDPDLSEQAVTNSFVPISRPDTLAARAEVIAAAIVEETRTAPRPTVDPNAVVVPTSANVAAEATIENGINLQATSLIGVYGSDGARRALVRQRGGRYKMLEMGDKIDGWTVVAISESELTIQKGGKTKVLKLPS